MSCQNMQSCFAGNYHMHVKSISISSHSFWVYRSPEAQVDKICGNSFQKHRGMIVQPDEHNKNVRLDKSIYRWKRILDEDQKIILIVLSMRRSYRHNLNEYISSKHCILFGLAKVKVKDLNIDDVASWEDHLQTWHWHGQWCWHFALDAIGWGSAVQVVEKSNSSPGLKLRHWRLECILQRWRWLPGDITRPTRQSCARKRQR